MGMPPIPAPPGNVNKINPREAGMVVAAGAVGGFVFWIIAKWTETSLPTVFGSATVPVLMFLGAIAALIGVYFLTASDTTAVRTYIFALLCGVAWDPMINSGVQIVTNAAVKSQTDDLGNKVQQMKDATKTGDVTAILNNSTDVADAAKRTEIVDKSRQAIGELQTSAAKAPESSVDALKNITLAADKSGQSAVGIDAIQTLDTIAGDAVRSKNVPLSQRIRTSLDYVVNNSNNPAIQSAAKLTLGELNSGAR